MDRSKRAGAARRAVRERAIVAPSLSRLRTVSNLGNGSFVNNGIIAVWIDIIKPVLGSALQGSMLPPRYRLQKSRSHGYLAQGERSYPHAFC